MMVRQSGEEDYVLVVDQGLQLFERIQLRELNSKKRNGKDIFDRDKLLKSMEIALRKRQAEEDAIERAQNGIVRQLNPLVKMKFNQNVSEN